MGDPVKNIVNFRTSGVLNPAEITFQVSDGVENATIDWTQRNFEETTLEIWTGPGSTGTKLTLTTDYSLSLKNDFVSAKSGLEIYSGVQITNVTYQSVPLYIPINTLNMFGDIIDESDINRLQENKITGLIAQILKAWVNFDGTGVVSITDSFNVSSITDLGTGFYRANFTTNLPDADYATVAAGECPQLFLDVSNKQTVSGVTFKTTGSSGTFTDYAVISIACLSSGG